MSWRPLSEFSDSVCPKLDRLRRAARARFKVPETFWVDPMESVPPAPPIHGAFILRSASPFEDGVERSQAGVLHSEVVSVEARAQYDAAYRRVYEKLVTHASGSQLGYIFAQPYQLHPQAGVAFFDDFYCERTSRPDTNIPLTAGTERGTVVRESRRRGDPWSQWLTHLHSTFGCDASAHGTLDIEYAATCDPPTCTRDFLLLQVRPAAFQVERNRTLSLANHQEILGELPSPWIVSVLAESGQSVNEYFTRLDPSSAGSQSSEPYAVELGGRAWMNFSFFFRLMDRWGLPRTFVTEGVGGDAESPLDHRFDFSRLVRSAPQLMKLQWQNFTTVLRIRRGLDRLRREVSDAHSLESLFRANVSAMSFAIQTNFAINGILSGVLRVRRLLGLQSKAIRRQSDGLVTREMMDGYEAIRNLPKADRARGLDRWLEQYGHRGPLESDPRQPRFLELHGSLMSDLMLESAIERPETSAPSSAIQSGFRRMIGWCVSPFFWIDRRRESFRDELMRIWSDLRQRLLAEADDIPELESKNDVFWLAGDQLSDASQYRVGIASAQYDADRLRRMPFPLTSTADALARILESEPTLATPTAGSPRSGAGSFAGISIRSESCEGRVRKAQDLRDLMAELSDPAIAAKPHEEVLVVRTLEPAWAVVFPRFRAVIAEIGGELSHGAILLREAECIAIVNCRGVFDGVNTGTPIRVDGVRGAVSILE